MTSETTHRQATPAPGDTGGGCLVWHGDRLVRAPAEPGPPMVADSWLVEDGRVRGIDLHRRRFTESCIELGAGPGALAGFWTSALDRLPRDGSWFPRVELAEVDGRPELLLRIRPAPRRTATATVWTGAEPDPRQHPRHKGPDLELLARLRHAGTAAGAHEVLLTSPSGLVLEAANASLLWWEDDVLCVPDPDLPVLPGVTVAIVRRFAERVGVPVRHRRRRLDELAGREVWLANALHGIRPVTGWVGSPGTTVGAAHRCTRWRRWWSEYAVRLPPRDQALSEVDSRKRTGMSVRSD